MLDLQTPKSAGHPNDGGMMVLQALAGRPDRPGVVAFAADPSSSTADAAQDSARSPCWTNARTCRSYPWRKVSAGQSASLALASAPAGGDERHEGKHLAGLTPHDPPPLLQGKFYLWSLLSCNSRYPVFSRFPKIAAGQLTPFPPFTSGSVDLIG